MPKMDISYFLNCSVKDITGKGRRGEHYGVEIEMEGRNLILPPNDETDKLRQLWVEEADGSLRNHHGGSIEWVMRNPLTLPKTVSVVKKLFEELQKNKAKIIPSNRTSVHVHRNVGDLKVYQVVNLFILFSVLEGVLDKFCGEDREGNLFCLSTRHAEWQFKMMQDSVLLYQNFREFQNGLRYSSLNLSALNKYGSVEFRGMRGVDEAEPVLDWLNIIDQLCRFAFYNIKAPHEMLEQISIDSPSGFLKKIFSPNEYDLLTRNLSRFELDTSVFTGIRNVQMLAYKLSDEYKGVQFKVKDFWEEKAQEVGKERGVAFEDLVEDMPIAPNPRVRLVNPFEGAEWREIPLRNHPPRDDLEF